VSNKVASLPQKLQIIGISHWLSDCARESRVFAGCQVETISNNVDTQQFRPIDPDVAREILGLRKDRRIILAGAHRVSDFYKGFDLFVEAMRTLDMLDVQLVLFGNVSDRDLRDLRVEYSNLGFLSDTVSLRLAYAAADVFVAPSRMEAFGKTLAEAMACGTPVVCFDATGTRDVVEHEVTGFKATPFDPTDLARGVRWVLSRNPEEHTVLRKGARKRAVTHFESRVIATKYRELYERVLRGA
jgi:glycosyltransferase involved in cell wall biosynthesis